MEVKTAEEYKLTAKDAAKILGISERTLHNWRVTKYGPPYIKLGAIYRYSMASIEKWMISKVEVEC